MVTTGSARYPGVLETLQRKGADYTCSYEEEKQAMLLALKWTLKENRFTDTVICTDSKSLLQAIQNYSPELSEIHDLLSSLVGRMTLQWVPSHSNIPGNELADKAAKDATKLSAKKTNEVLLSVLLLQLSRELWSILPLPTV